MTRNTPLLFVVVVTGCLASSPCVRRHRSRARPIEMSASQSIANRGIRSGHYDWLFPRVYSRRNIALKSCMTVVHGFAHELSGTSRMST